MGGARAAVAAASVALLLHYTRLAHGVTLREVGVLDAGADLEGFSLEPQDAIPPVTSLKLAWNGAEPPVVTHYAPTLLTEDRTGAVKSSHLALFERTIAKGYTLPMRDGIASHWQAGKHLFLAWYRKGPKPLIDVLSQAHGFGRLQGKTCVRPCATSPSDVSACVALHSAWGVKPQHKRVRLRRSPAAGRRAARMRAQKRGQVRKGSVLRVEFPSPEAMGSFAAELNAACAVSNAVTPYGAPLSWTPEGGLVLPKRLAAAAAAPAKPASLASRSTPVLLSYRLKHVALTQCAESPLDAAMCSAETLRGLPPRVLASSAKAVGEQPLVELVRGQCAGEKDGGGLPYVASPGLASLRESCRVRLKFGVVDLAPRAKRGAKGASLPSSPRLPATLAAEAAFAVSFFAALAAAPAVQGSDPNHPAKRLSDVVAQLAAVGVSAQPLTPVFADASFVLVCAYKDCGLGNAAAKAAGIAPRVRYGLKLSALTPHSGLQAHAALTARSTVLLGRRRSDSELTSRVVGFLSRPAKTAPARPGKPLLPPAAFARDAAVPDLHGVARSRALQAGLVHLAATVSLWLAATAQVPPASRGGDLLAVDRACGSDAGGVFGRCGAAASPRLLNKWGTLLAARPRAVFGAASMPPAARPGGSLGRALSASNAALRRVARAFVRHLVSPRVRADAFPGLSDAHVEAVVAAALLATFSADSPAAAWKPVPRPLPLVTIGGEPAFFVEDRRPAHSLALGSQGFVPVPVSGPRFTASEGAEGAGMRADEADAEAAAADADAFLELEEGSGEGTEAEAWGGEGTDAWVGEGTEAVALADVDAEIAAWSCLGAWEEGEAAAADPAAANATERAPRVPRSQPGLLIAGSRAVLQSLDRLRGMNELQDAASRRALALAALPTCRPPAKKAKKRLRRKGTAAAANAAAANATAVNATTG